MRLRASANLGVLFLLACTQGGATEGESGAHGQRDGEVRHEGFEVRDGPGPERDEGTEAGQREAEVVPDCSDQVRFVQLDDDTPFGKPAEVYVPHAKAIHIPFEWNVVLEPFLGQGEPKQLLVGPTSLNIQLPGAPTSRPGLRGAVDPRCESHDYELSFSGLQVRVASDDEHLQGTFHGSRLVLYTDGSMQLALESREPDVLDLDLPCESPQVLTLEIGQDKGSTLVASASVRCGPQSANLRSGRDPRQHIELGRHREP